MASTVSASAGSATRLGARIEGILREADEPLTIAECQRRLRRTGSAVAEPHICRVLGDERIFLLVGNDRWWLRSRLHELYPASELADCPPERGVPTDSDLPLLRNLPAARRNYVVLDLETTGTDPERDRIIQIVAIRYDQGRPIALFSRRCSPDGVTVPRSLMRTLGFLDHPARWDATLAAPPFRAIAEEVQAFIGTDPIVAHNARFDTHFLRIAFGTLTNPVVDTLELGYLLFPDLPSHGLEQVVTRCGVDGADGVALWRRLSEAGSAAIVNALDAVTFHDANTDTCLLALAYPRMLDQLDAPAGLDPCLRTLLPELFGGTWTEDAVDAIPFLAAVAPVLPADLPPAPPVLLAEADADTVNNLLDRIREKRGFAYRPGQAEMAAAVYRAFTDERFSMIEAPTGTGKSIAYIVPAAVHAASTGERVLLSTAYVTLQDQLLEDLAQLGEVTGLPIRYQVLKGLGNEVCRTRVARAIAELDNQSALDERFVLAVLLAWLAAHPDSDRSNFPFWIRRTFPVATHVLDETSAAHTGCRGAECQTYGCAAWCRAELANSAHLLVVNHALWLADPARLPDATRLVIDEAHTLEDVTTSAFTEESSLSEIRSATALLVDRRTGRGVLPRLLAVRVPSPIAAAVRASFDAEQVVGALARDYGEHVQTFVRRASGNQPDRRYGATYRLESAAARIAPTQWPPLERASIQLYDTAIGDLVTAIRTLRDILTAHDTTPSAFATAIGEIDTVIELLVQQQAIHLEVVEARRRGIAYWIALEPQPTTTTAVDGSAAAEFVLKNWAFRKAPIRVDDLLRDRFTELDGAVLVSATLALGSGDLRFFRERLGLDTLVEPGDELVVDGELDYATNAFFGIAGFLDATPAKRTIASFQDELAKEFGEFLPFAGGRSLGLFTARVRLDEVVRRTRPALEQHGLTLLSQEPGSSKTSLLADFRADEHSTLFGLRSYWEGVDVPGPALSFVLMEKLPFPALREPISVARREDVHLRGGREFEEYTFPLMALQFKQGFGRLLRAKDDRGAVILYDKRVLRKGYLNYLLASLPGYVPRDPRVERSRRRFYEAIAAHLPEIIDLDAHRSWLDALPDRLITDLEARLATWSLPERVAGEDYDHVRPTLLAALQGLWGFPGFRSGAQEQVIRHILAGQDVLALLPTGAGKSLCFQLPALLRPGLTLVVSPLIALMRDQVQSLLERGIEVADAMLGGQSAAEREETLARVRAGRLKLLYVAPERLRDPALLSALAAAQVTSVVVDEAHCVATWGPQFRPDFLRITALLNRMPTRPPIAAFTATATPEMRREITAALGVQDPATVVASFDRPELRFVVANPTSVDHPIRSRRDRLALLIRVLQAADAEEASSLVYVSTTVEADLLARRLRSMGFAARAYHGKLDPAERETIQDLFMDDQITVVVCTKAFGMGIDKPDIRYVIHAQMPGDLESYFQEAGRAGRDGKTSYCVLLAHDGDERIHEFFIDQAAPDLVRTELLLRAVRRSLVASGGKSAVVDPEAIVEETGIDETQLNVLLHRLETAGIVARGDDVTLQAAITLREGPAAIASAIANDDPDGARLL